MTQTVLPSVESGQLPPNYFEKDGLKLLAESGLLIFELMSAEPSENTRPLADTGTMWPPRLHGLFFAALRQQGHGVYFSTPYAVSRGNQDIFSFDVHVAQEQAAAFQALIRRSGEVKNPLQTFMQQMLSGRLYPHPHPLEYEPVPAEPIGVRWRDLTPDDLQQRGVLTSTLVADVRIGHMPKPQAASDTVTPWYRPYFAARVKQYEQLREAGVTPFGIPELLDMAGVVLDSHIRTIPNFPEPATAPK